MLRELKSSGQTHASCKYHAPDLSDDHHHIHKCPKFAETNCQLYPLYYNLILSVSHWYYNAGWYGNAPHSPITSTLTPITLQYFSIE